MAGLSTWTQAKASANGAEDVDQRWERDGDYDVPHKRCSKDVHSRLIGAAFETCARSKSSLDSSRCIAFRWDRVGVNARRLQNGKCAPTRADVRVTARTDSDRRATIGLLLYCDGLARDRHGHPHGHGRKRGRPVRERVLLALRQHQESSTFGSTGPCPAKVDWMYASSVVETLSSSVRTHRHRNEQPHQHAPTLTYEPESSPASCEPAATSRPITVFLPANIQRVPAVYARALDRKSRAGPSSQALAFDAISSTPTRLSVFNACCRRRPSACGVPGTRK